MHSAFVLLFGMHLIRLQRNISILFIFIISHSLRVSEWVCKFFSLFIFHLILWIFDVNFNPCWFSEKKMQIKLSTMWNNDNKEEYFQSICSLKLYLIFFDFSFSFWKFVCKWNEVNECLNCNLVGHTIYIPIKQCLCVFVFEIKKLFLCLCKRVDWRHTHTHSKKNCILRQK